jgi:hypothetical protein
VIQLSPNHYQVNSTITVFPPSGPGYLNLTVEGSDSTLSCTNGDCFQFTQTTVTFIGLTFTSTSESYLNTGMYK